MWHNDFSIYDLKITGKFDISGVISNTMPTIPRGLDEKEKDTTGWILHVNFVLRSSTLLAARINIGA